MSESQPATVEIFPSSAQFANLERRLVEAFREMDVATRDTQLQTFNSFRDFIIPIIEAAAGALGYVIGNLAGLAVQLYEGVKSNFAAGFRAGYNAGRSRQA